LHLLFKDSITIIQLLTMDSPACELVIPNYL
jgi:hypothetical protein